MSKSKYDNKCFWVDPDIRGVFEFSNFHIPKSLIKLIRRHDFEVRFNTDFVQTIEKCAEFDLDRPDTWINEDIKNMFIDLHFQGISHSVEYWYNDIMVGGLYGLVQNGVFFGESMFSRHSNASKICLVYLMSRLYRSGFQLVDAQFDNDHLKQFGLLTIERQDFQKRLESALLIDCSFDDSTTESFQELQSFIHLITQTS